MANGHLTFTDDRRGDPLGDAERAAILANPGFGNYFTDHMVKATWTTAEGWHDGRLMPYGPITLDPSAAVLHYAQEIFEGLKAYKRPDGTVWAFRPDANAARFQRSATPPAPPRSPRSPSVPPPAPPRRTCPRRTSWTPWGCSRHRTRRGPRRAGRPAC